MTKHMVYEDFRQMITTLDIPKGKQKVMIAALELFSEQGFDGTSTAQIAERSGMSEATLFKYFKTKKILLFAIITPIIENLTPKWGEEFTLTLAQQNSDLRSLIHYIVQDRWSFLTANALSVSIILNEVMTNSEVLSLFNTTFQQYFACNGTQILTAFKNTGELDPTQNLRTIARLFVGQLLVLFLEHVRFSADNINKYTEEDLAMIEEQLYRALNNNTVI